MTCSTDKTSLALRAGEVEGAKRSEVRLIGRHVLLVRQRRISPAFPGARFPSGGFEPPFRLSPTHSDSANLPA